MLGLSNTPLLIQVLFESVNQDRDSIEAEPFAFMMKIKVRVVHFRAIELFKRPLERLLDWLFVPFLIDEVDEVDVPIRSVKAVEMQTEGFDLPNTICDMSAASCLSLSLILRIKLSTHRC